MFPPAVEDGALPLTAFWLLNAAPAAHWLVSALWTPAWKPPAPPQPARHEPPPMFWLRCWSWSVLALFETSADAFDVALWLAELGPEEMSPPAIETGVFEFTAFWSLNAAPAATWLVSAFCTPSWKPPAPPQPATHSALRSRGSQPHQRSPMFCCSDWSWSVFALFETSA